MQMVTREIKKGKKIQYIQELENVYVDEGYVIDTFNYGGYKFNAKLSQDNAPTFTRKTS